MRRGNAKTLHQSEAAEVAISLLKDAAILLVAARSARFGDAF